jgi:predicted nucleotidyltransferase
MEKYINIAKEIVLKRVPLHSFAVFLFGSRADGSFHQRSDIDIGIWGYNSLSTSIKLDLEQDLEDSDIIFKVDLIDFNQASEDFIKEATNKIQIWNRPKDFTLI